MPVYQVKVRKVVTYDYGELLVDAKTRVDAERIAKDDAATGAAGKPYEDEDWEVYIVRAAAP